MSLMSKFLYTITYRVISQALTLHLCLHDLKLKKMAFEVILTTECIGREMPITIHDAQTYNRRIMISPSGHFSELGKL